MNFNPNQNIQNQGQNQNVNTQSSSSSSNQQGAMVPEARQALNNMKYEIAGELGINLKQGYNGDLPSRQAGYIGGYMTNILLPGRRSQSTLSTALPVIRRMESFGVLPSISMSAWITKRPSSMRSGSFCAP